MAADYALIKAKFPSLLFVYEEDTRFSDIPVSVRQHVAMTLAVSERVIWKRLASDIGLSNDIIDYCTTLKKHNGCAVMNMLDYYMMGSDSLRILVEGLAKLKLDRVLLVLADIYMRKYSICITHLYLEKLPNASPESVLYDNSALSLANCLQNNDFRIQMDVPNIRRVPSHLDWRQWVDTMFNEADYILVCMTPEYLTEISAETDPMDGSEEFINNLQSTRYIYRLMQRKSQSIGRRNQRFIPVILKNSLPDNTSVLPEYPGTVGTRSYAWPQDYEDLMWRLDLEPG